MTGSCAPVPPGPQAGFLSSRSRPVAGSLTLPARLDSQAAGRLFETLGTCRGGPLMIDTAAVAFLGALALQVLLAARRQWDADGQPMTFTPTDARFFDLVRLLGVLPAQLQGPAPQWEST